MSTFHNWLEDQREREGPAGETARWWVGDTAERPRVYSPSSIQKYLDRELREGRLAGLDAGAKGRMREQFADAVREYHDRDKPEAAKASEDGSLRAYMAETREALRMLRHGQNRIMAALGLDTPYGERTGPLTMEIPVRAGDVVNIPPGGAVVTPATASGHRAALEIRARMGDGAAAAELEDARRRSLQEAVAVGAELAAASPQMAAEPFSPDGAGDPGPELSAEDWDLLWRVADHRRAQTLEGMPDDYAA